MEMSKVEIIEPIQNETFFSWIWRLGDWYGYTNLNEMDYYQNFMKTLFGENSKIFIGLHVPSNLKKFVNNVRLSDSRFFKSSESIINQMTLFGFYKNFMTYEARNRFIALLEGKNELINTERKLGIRSNASYYENFPRIKFCKECIKEKRKFYLEVDHQVQGNLVCYKHGTRLQFYPFNVKEISDYRYFADKCEEAEYCIVSNEKLVIQYKAIAVMVHQVIFGNLGESVVKLKSKLRKRLSELGWLYDTLYISDIDKLMLDFEVHNIYSISKKQLYEMIYSTNRKVNAIMYLSLIHYLFGSFDEYKAYIIAAEDIIDLKRNDSSYDLWVKGPYNDDKSYQHYSHILQMRFGDEFTLIDCKLKDNKIKIRHNKCGRERELFKSGIRKFKNCYYCYYNTKYKNYLKDLTS